MICWSGLESLEIVKSKFKYLFANMQAYEWEKSEVLLE